MQNCWGNGARLVLAAVLAITLLGAAPAGATVVYAHNGPAVRPGGIWVMSDDGSGKRELIPQSATGVGENLSDPSVDPRGGFVLFTGHGAIWKWEKGTTVNLTRQLSTVVGSGGSGFAVSGNGYAAAVGDGTFVWQYTTALSSGSWTNANTMIKHARLDGKGGLADIPRSCGTPWQDAMPAPRPGGGVAYLGCSFSTGSFPNSHSYDQIMLYGSTGSQQELANAEDVTFKSLSWNPAGNRIVAVVAEPTSYFSATTKFAQSIWVIDVGGAAHQVLATQNGLISSPRFIGESRIVFGFSATGSNRSNIYSLPVTCDRCALSAATQLTTDGVSTEPAWTLSALTVPPRDGASVQARQTLRTALARGLKLTVVCNNGCLAGASATIDGRLARSLGLLSRSSKSKTFQVATGSLRAGQGSRTLTLTFSSRANKALGRLRNVKLSLQVRCMGLSSGGLTTYTGSVTVGR